MFSITITLTPERPIQVQSNLAPTQRPLLRWMLKHAELLILTAAPDPSKSALVKPNGALTGMLTRMQG